MISRIPCPYEQPRRRQAPLRQRFPHTSLYNTYSFLGLVRQLTHLTAAPSRLIKGDLFWFFFQTSPSLTPLPYRNNPGVLASYLLRVVDTVMWLTEKLRKGFINEHIVRNTGELWQIAFSKEDCNNSSFPTSSFHNATLTSDVSPTEE